MTALRLRAFQVKCTTVAPHTSDEFRAFLKATCRFHGWDPDGMSTIFVQTMCGCTTVWLLDGNPPANLIEPEIAEVAVGNLRERRRAEAH